MFDSATVAVIYWSILHNRFMAVDANGPQSDLYSAVPHARLCFLL